MKHTNWPFDSASWWMRTIHHEIKIPLPDTSSSDDILDDEEEYFARLNVSYTPNLRRISMLPETESKTHLRALLFGAKALKKWRIASNRLVRTRAEKAYLGFSERNALCRRPAIADMMSPIGYIMAQLLDSWLPRIDVEAVHGRFGPGACYERFNHWLRFRRLHDWLSSSSTFPECPMGHSDFDRVTVRLCAVPKDRAKDRLITVEPMYGTWAQQWARTCLLHSISSGPLRGTAADLERRDVQEIQRRRALLGSASGRLATIDLSDASDGISWLDVQSVFPPWIIQLLEVTRSRTYVVPGSQTPEEILMYAGMGNATTFVVETMFFLAYVVACSRYLGLKRPSVTVFGDDIIATRECAAALVESGLGQQPWFRINYQKSFYREDDHLRESCGIFAHSGRDITVPRIDGYRPTWDGRLAVADLWRRLQADVDEYFVLAHLLASTGAMDNASFLIEGYPSISDWGVPFTIPRSAVQWSRQQQRSYIKLRAPYHGAGLTRLREGTSDGAVAYAAHWSQGLSLTYRGAHSFIPSPGRMAGAGAMKLKRFFIGRSGH